AIIAHLLANVKEYRHNLIKEIMTIIILSVAYDFSRIKVILQKTSSIDSDICDIMGRGCDEH
ncbi:MAG: hypothetical protein ACJ709_03875, partial [Nitrososphaeraceae archaeon]